MIRILFLTFGMLLASCSAQSQAPDWRLADANKFEQKNFLILTIPLDDPVVMAAIASEIAEDFGVPFTAEWPLNSIGVLCLIYDASGTADVERLIALMEADDRVRTAQLIQDFTVSEVLYPDPLFPLQWSLDRMNAGNAHQISKGAGIRIGIVDSAIDKDHLDLRRQIADARDFVAATPVPLAEAHGTAIAGAIAASAANNAGIVGIAPEADLVGLRACWQAPGESGKCNTFSLARALNFAILNDIDVLNMSVGGPQDPLLQELIEDAMRKGMIVVAASGETSRIAFPASMPGVIAAGSGGLNGIPAPMVDIITTAPGDRHRYVSGTSIATAHVSGVVALMLAENPNLTSTDVAAAMSATIANRNDIPSVDACEALIATGAPAGSCL